MTAWRSMTMHDALAAGGPDAVATASARMHAALPGDQASLGSYSWLSDSEVDSDEGPLAGFHCAVKANISVRGWPNDCGSRILAAYRSPFDATVIERLRAAGCGFSGLTVMDEFGMGSSCEYSCHGPARNPWDRIRTPGGSSGGSAAAVASGSAWFALGSDTGGSVRYPAHCCGLVGLKPTYGRISRYGLVAFASSLDTIGVLARDVADAALVFGLIAGADPRDATSTGQDEGESPGAWTDLTVAGMTLGMARGLISGQLDQAESRDFEDAIGRLVSGGVVCVDVDIPEATAALGAYALISSAEASSNLARFDGSLYGQRSDGAGDETPYLRMICGTRSAGFGPEVKRRILLGTHALSTGNRDRMYARAHLVREQLRRRFAVLLQRCDALVMPTAAEGAFLLGSRLGNPVSMQGTDRFTVLASLAGLPALTVPTGLDGNGMPLSLQLVGAPGAESKLLALGKSLEERTGFRDLKEAPWHR